MGCTMAQWVVTVTTRNGMAVLTAESARTKLRDFKSMAHLCWPGYHEANISWKWDSEGMLWCGELCSQCCDKSLLLLLSAVDFSHVTPEQTIPYWMSFSATCLCWQSVVVLARFDEIGCLAYCTCHCLSRSPAFPGHIWGRQTSSGHGLWDCIHTLQIFGHTASFGVVKILVQRYMARAELCWHL